MRGKFVTIFLGLLGLLVAAVVFRVDQVLFADKLDWSESQARVQVGAVSESLQSELRLVRETLELAWPQIQAEKKDYPAGKPYSRFQMIGTLSQSASGEWSLGEKFFLEGSSVKSWATNYSVLALRQLNAKNIPVGGSGVLSILDPSRRIYFLVVNRVNSGWLAALVGPELFQGAVDRQKGSLGQVYAVNSLGQTLGHTTPEYVGSLLTDDPLVADLMKSESGAGAGMFKTAQGPVQGLYEQVPNSNVYVVVSTKLSQILGNRKEVQIQLILLGLGFALVGSAVILAVSKPSAPKTMPSAIPTSVMPAPVTKPALNAAPGADNERREAYSKAAAGLANELRGPLLSLLGQARLLRENTSDEHLAQELKKLEEGAREAHGTVHKMLTFAGEKDEPLVETSIAEVLKRTIRVLDSKISGKGIEVLTNVQADAPLIKGQPLMLSRAFEQILLNAIEAMERSLERKLFVELLTDENGDIRVKIRDTGSGIAPENVVQVFDPFFSTKNKNDHSGLGLSLALGVVKGSGGDIQVHSDSGKGTTVDITFKKDAEIAPSTSADPAPRASSLPPTSSPFAPRDKQGETAAVTAAAETELPGVLNEKLMQRTLDMIDRLDELNEPFVDKRLEVPTVKSRPDLESEDSFSFGGPAGASQNESIEFSPDNQLNADGSNASGSSQEDFMKFTAKIDKPKSLKPSRARQERLLEADVHVRRPGERT